MRELRRTALFSAALYALAFLLTNVAHELAHALVGLALDRGPTLSFASVSYARDGSTRAQVATAAAGPLFSLVSGALFFALQRRRSLGPKGQLFVLWLAYHGLVNFVGYVFTTWFAATADAGRVARLLSATTPALVVVTVLGWAGLMVLARPFGAPFAELAPSDDSVDAQRWARTVALAPALMATPVMAAGFLPVPHWLSLLYVLTTPMALYDIVNRVAAAPKNTAHTALVVSARAASAAVATAVTAWIVARVALGHGVSIGR